MNFKTEYLEYLKTEHWRALRRAVMSRDQFKCVQCASARKLQVHHKFYRDKWEDSQPEDLITLCRDCHRQEHAVAVKIDPRVVSRIGSRMWNELGQLVNSEGIPYSAFQRKKQRRKRPKIIFH